jgi:hypothetical protein
MIYLLGKVSRFRELICPFTREQTRYVVISGQPIKTPILRLSMGEPKGKGSLGTGSFPGPVGNVGEKGANHALG